MRQFVALHKALGADKYELPPKRILATTFVPSAWLDDELIAERKSGLTSYLSHVIGDPEFQSQPALKDFLGSPKSNAHTKFDLEDALPSTLSRKTALQLKEEALKGAGSDSEVEIEATFIAASYYPGRRQVVNILCPLF